MAVQKKHLYVHAFGIIVIVLALVRCVFDVGRGENDAEVVLTDTDTLRDDAVLPSASLSQEGSQQPDVTPAPLPQEGLQQPDVTSAPLVHPIKGVTNYAEAFPDSNHVQLVAAQQWGVTPVKNRADAELRKNEVVFVGSSPYYDVAPLNASIPYLVPRAAILLQDIGSLFFDSLQAKGLPLHRIVVSSVLRTEDDVARLRRSNHNATEQSCHLYGTTFDINYNAYNPIDERRPVGSDKLKYVLSEVLRDLRQQGRCYIKYEIRQPCFHMTVR